MTEGSQSMGCAFTRQDLLPYLYEDLPAGRRESLDGHLATCARCRAELASFRETLGAVSDARLPERVAAAMPADWPAVWASLRDRILSEAAAPVAGRGISPLLKAAAVLLVAGASFAVGRQWDTLTSLGGPVPVQPMTGRTVAPDASQTPEDAAARLQLFSEQTHGYLNRSRLVLMEFANARETGDSRLVREASNNLLRETKAARRVAGQISDPRIEDLLAQVETLLGEIARLSDSGDATTVNRIKNEVHESGVLDQLELLSFPAPRVAQERS